jgi:hypothetical protein
MPSTIGKMFTVPETLGFTVSVDLRERRRRHVDEDRFVAVASNDLMALQVFP